MNPTEAQVRAYAAFVPTTPEAAERLLRTSPEIVEITIKRLVDDFVRDFAKYTERRKP